MSLIPTLLNDPSVEAIGWALIHFVWQGTVIGLLLAGVLLVMQRRSSNAKYLTCCCGLLLMTVAPLATSVLLMRSDSVDEAPAAEVASGVAQATPEVRPVDDAANLGGAAGRTAPPVSQPDTVPPPRSPASPSIVGSEVFVVSGWLQNHLPWVLAGWVAGVVALSIRLLLCWLNVGRLSRQGTAHVSDSISAVFSDLVQRVGVSRTVRLFESSLVQVPTVLGALRPVILLPATVVTGLSMSQLEAILAHELAHVRRHDYLVNLLQTAVETLLFYHPVVWWISNRIRQEREHCCDDVASVVCGDRIEYVQALVRLEEVRGTTPQLAVAATGGSLVQRVRRLVAAPGRTSGEGRRPWWLGGAIPLSLLLLAASCMPFVGDEVVDEDLRDNGPDTYVVVWGAIVDRPLADRLLKNAETFDEQEGWVLRTADAAELRSELNGASDSKEVIRLFERMNWLAPLDIYMPEENLTGTLATGDNVQFREPGDRGHVLFTHDIIGQHRVLPAAGEVRLRLQTHHAVHFEAFNTPGGDKTSDGRGKIEIDHRIPDGSAMLVTRALDPVLEWSPVVITVFEPVRVPPRLSRQRQVHDLPTWLATGPQALRQRSMAADDWIRNVEATPVTLDGKWSQLLDSGSRITLVGLSSPKHCPTAWWTPEGEPLPFRFKQSNIGLQREELLALLHIVHSPDAAKNPTPVDLQSLVNPRSQMMSNGVTYVHGSDRAGMPDATNGHLVIVAASDSKTVEVGVGTGTGPRRDVGVVRKGEPLVLETGEFRASQVLKRRHHEIGDVTDVSMMFPWNRDLEVFVTAVGTDGEKLTSEYEPRVFHDRDSRTANVFDRFLTPPAEISHFEVQTAPLLWATFKDFSDIPGKLRVKQAVPEPVALAVVGWTFQGNPQALVGIKAAAKAESLGDGISWFRGDSEVVRRRFLKLREAGDADPPGPIVGWMFDFQQFMEVSGAGAYRGPALSSFPFGYPTGVLPPEQRRDVRNGMWRLEANVAAVATKSNAWQISGRWLVQENGPTAEGASRWKDVFDQALKFETAIPVGQVAVVTGPVPGLEASARTGFVVLESVPVPKSLLHNVRGRRTDIDQLLQFGPAETLALLAAGEVDDVSTPVSAGSVAATQSATVRGRVLNHNGKPVVGAAVFPLGSAYGRRTALTLQQGKSIGRINPDGEYTEDTKTIRSLTDADGRFEIRVRNVTDLAVSTTGLDVWEVPAPDRGEEALVRLPEPGQLIVSGGLARDGEKSRGFVSGPIHEKGKTREGEPLRTYRFRCVTRRTFELAGDAKQTIDSLPPGQYWIMRQRLLKHGDFQEGRGLDRRVITVKSGNATEFDFKRSAGTPADVQIAGTKENDIAWSVIEVQPWTDNDVPVDRWLYSDVGLATDDRFQTERLSAGRYRIRVLGYQKNDDEADRDYLRPDATGSAIVVIPESGDAPVVQVALRSPQDRQPAAETESKPTDGKKPAEAAAVSVFGRVLDDKTGEPVTKFITQAGKFDPKNPKDVTWGFSESGSGAASKGRFSTTVRWQAGWTSRILADGYVPQPVITKAPEEGQTRIEVELRLKRGRWVRGRVLDHTGKPAKGVSVYALGKRGINLAGGNAVNSFGGSDNSRVGALTNEDGRFEMTVGEATRLAVSSPEIDAWPGDLPEGMKETLIKLPEPGRVVVDFDIEGAGEKQEIFWQFLGHSMPGFEGITSEQTREAKNGEKLEITSLPPGKYQIGRSRMLRAGQMGMGRFLDRHWFSVKPGETVTIDFTRPKGARVKGMVVDLQTTTVKTALITVTPVKEPKNADATFEGWLTLDGQATDEDGEFTTERLPPGEYKVLAEVYLPLTPEQRFRTGIPTPTFTGETTVVVPDSGPAPDIRIELKERE